MDNETAKIEAQELDHEAPKECVPADDSASDASTPTVEHTDRTIDEKARDEEAVRDHSDATQLPIKVPRSQRRGLFGRFTLLAEITEPKHYPRRTKWWITFVIALAAVAAPLGSAIIFRMFPIFTNGLSG